MRIHRIAMMLGLCLAVAAAQANLVVNGSFEDRSSPDVTFPGSFNTLSAGSTDIAAWTIESGSVDWIGSYWAASDGLRSIDLNGYAANGYMVAQVLETTSGNWYELSFDMGANFDGPPAEKTVEVLLDGAVAGTFKKSTVGWETRVLLFQASGPTTLGFRSQSDGTSFGPALDKVSVVAVPVPGAAVLALIGLPIIGWVKRRFA